MTGRELGKYMKYVVDLVIAATNRLRCSKNNHYKSIIVSFFTQNRVVLVCLNPINERRFFSEGFD